MLAAGDVAPDFPVGDRTLYEILRTHVVVLFFFPRVFTPTCTREASGFCRSYDALHAEGVEIVGVSSDPQAKSEAFRGELGLPYALVGDPSGAVLRAYGVRWPIVGIAKRGTFVIGRDRKVVLAFRSEFDAEAHLVRATAAAREAAARG
jgi:thioredoxin-dependent peroxiredoxin